MERVRKKSAIFSDRMYICRHCVGSNVYQHTIYAFKVSVNGDAIIMQNNKDVIVAIFPVENTSIIHVEEP